MATKNFIGEKYGRLTVLARLGLYAHCLCDCGATCSPRMDKLREGRTKSCGCLARELADKSRVVRPPKAKRKPISADERRLRNVYSSMLQRCSNPNHSDYAYYGGRGIYIAAEWMDRDVFLAWALPRYRKGLWLERKDNEGPYAPWNCAMTSPKKQARNRTNTLWVDTDNGRRSLAHFAAYAGIDYQKAYRRYCDLVRSGYKPHAQDFGGPS